MAWAAIGTAVIGGFLGSRANAKAKYAAMLNARAQDVRAKEEIRRTDIMNRQQLGRTLAHAGGSGAALTPGTTPTMYYGSMKEELGKEMNFMQMARQLSFEANVKGANVQYQAAQLQLYNQVATGVINAYASWYKSGP